MSAEPFSLLICTNGNEQTRPALNYGVWLAALLKTPVTLLGVVENREDPSRVQHLVDEAAQKLTGAGVPYEIRLEQGRGTFVIARIADSGAFLTVLGRLGRPAWRRAIQGRSFRRVLEHVRTPILYVPEPQQGLRHVLVCLGGLGYAESVERLGLHLARIAGAAFTLLHVVEPVTMDYPVSKAIHDHWQQIQETDTPQGKNLRKALEEAQTTDISVQLKVRHGNAVHEILEEVNSGDYDLIGMGSPYSTHSLRHLYMPNVTAEVAEGAHCPILAVRQGFSLV